MQLLPRDLFEKLEFDKVLELLERECLGELGRAAVRCLQPISRLGSIEKRLEEASEFKRTIEQNDRFPIAVYSDVSEELKMLEVEGYVLPEDGLRNINIQLRSIRDIFHFFYTSRRETYSTLYSIIRKTSFEEGLIEAIEKV
ncbi:MAG: endonuclease MutS2, partial [Phaeodactylibacter sp.]|nr:endonuclease MutS2 [Phaeodactylibacter sp.]